MTPATSCKKPVAMQDRLLVRREHSIAWGAVGGATEEIWLLGSDIAEIFLLSPDTDRLAVIAATLASTAGSSIALREKAETSKLNLPSVNKRVVVYPTSIVTSDRAATLHGSGERIEVVKCSHVNEILSGIEILQQSVLESVSPMIELSLRGAKKKRRKVKGKGSHLHPQLGIILVEQKEMRRIPTHSQSNDDSLSSPVPLIQESFWSEAAVLTESGNVNAEDPTIDCHKPPTALADVVPACAEFIFAPHNLSLQLRQSPMATIIDDDYDAMPMTVSFADMFEALLSEKRKVIQ